MAAVTADAATGKVKSPLSFHSFLGSDATGGAMVVVVCMIVAGGGDSAGDVVGSNGYGKEEGRRRRRWRVVEVPQTSHEGSVSKQLT